MSVSTQSDSMSIAAIVPTFRRWPYLLSTIEQLLSQTRVPDEIIVIDQTPSDEIDNEDRQKLEHLQSRHPGLVYCYQQNPHVYRARNLAASLAQSDLLLYLDDDVRLDESLVEQHLLIMADPTIEAAVGRIISSSATVTSRPEIPHGISPITLAFHFARFRDDRFRDRIAYCAAGNVCIRRATLDAVQGWDEHILTYGDKDLGLRFYAAGKRVVYSPRPSLVHLVAPRGGTRLTDRRLPWNSWQRAVSIHYLALRHLKGWNYLRFGLARAARHTFLLRQNAIRPWRWLPEVIGFTRGYVVARRWLRDGVQSSFHREASETPSGSRAKLLRYDRTTTSI